MSNEEIFQTMRELVAEQFAMEPAEVTMDTDFAEDLGADSVDLVELVMAMEASLPVVSISRPAAGEDSSLTLMDQLEDDKNFEVPVLNKIAVDQAMEELEEQERKLLSLRYLENLTQAKAAAVLGLNQVAVSRMERKILKKLRKMMA